jgi:putative hydrolase of the HAD superfamily
MWVHSNYTPWVSEIRARLNLDRFFQGYAMSFELKARKPEVKAYQAALAMMGKTAHDCLLIDDRRENVNAVRSIGMAALKFENVAKLRQALLAMV